MKLSRPSRFLAALVTIFSLLFTQLALASYVCPTGEPTAPTISAGAGEGAMPDCAGMDTQQSGLCQAHCIGEKQTLDAPAAPNVAPFVASTLACVLPDTRPGADVAYDDMAATPLQHATAPPIAIRNCCFRI
jgi:hypothetical protein